MPNARILLTSTGIYHLQEKRGIYWKKKKGQSSGCVKTGRLTDAGYDQEVIDDLVMPMPSGWLWLGLFKDYSSILPSPSCAGPYKAVLSGQLHRFSFPSNPSLYWGGTR